MSKIIGVALALTIVKASEIVVLYHALPILRRLWERVRANGNTAYFFETFVLSVPSAQRTTLGAIRNTFRSASRTRNRRSLQIPARNKNEND